ncbi:hypothetical protein QJS66_16540 [Kocuria rhizophila]|nr:hypothetical protein QJS66_16540 [Kocuria rhizophila]
MQRAVSWPLRDLHGCAVTRRSTASGIAHGGMIFALADSCFAMTCNHPDPTAPPSRWRRAWTSTSSAPHSPGIPGLRRAARSPPPDAVAATSPSPPRTGRDRPVSAAQPTVPLRQKV